MTPRRIALVVALGACGGQAAEPPRAPAEPPAEPPPVGFTRHVVLAADGTVRGPSEGSAWVAVASALDLPANKDCSVPIAQVGDQFAALHKTFVVKKKHTHTGEIDRTLIHIKDPDDATRYFEILYRHDAREASAKISFYQYDASENAIEAPLPADEIRDLQARLDAAMRCR